jgi:hypothetical protein
MPLNLHPTEQIKPKKVAPVLSSLNDDEFVRAGSVEELVAEAEILREELGSLIRELRTFIEGIRAGDFAGLDDEDLAGILEDIIDG